MTLLRNDYFLFVIRLILSGVFIFAGIEKISDPNGFSVAIDNYRLFPDFMINTSAVILPWIEVIAGILLLFGSAVKENALIFNTLLVIFIIIIIVSLFRGLDIDCGCFGTSAGQKVGLLKIVENVFLLSGGLLLQKYNSTKFVISD